ncbi:MAG: bifunctional homocysteine S-methyltransferase/methylenetetrahydrofolate reductase [Clostridiaceae bacterium]|nr:bifunctional homocysteine S-methyltransferase/methylenetetrahydrofolate reductase [Clostridiaceae bacterium]
MSKTLEFLSHSDLILADGAMGTWYVNKYHKSLADCENDNIDTPVIIREIHYDYIQAGAILIRTNTFALLNTESCQDPARIGELAAAGFRIAKAAGSKSDHPILIGADFGPVYGLEPEQYLPAWQSAVNAFIVEGAELFVLETFAGIQEMLPLLEMIKKAKPDAIILASFAISADGFTRKGLSLTELDQLVSEIEYIDIFGLNCGVGPTHLRQILSKIAEEGKPLSLMPNSGYPRLENQRMVFGSTPEYFASSALELKHPRLRILGGCCGTTPLHINELNMLLHKTKSTSDMQSKAKSSLPSIIRSDDSTETSRPEESTQRRIDDKFINKLAQGEFITVCELDPPRNSDMQKILAAAHELKDSSIDAITISDSPLARVKLDPIVAASRIYRETGMPVLPHLTCRDRNVNALISIIMGAHSEGIRQLLLVTGDRLPESDRGFVKPVFNVSSTGMLDLVTQLNKDMFIDDPVLLSAACDLGVSRPEAELKRVLEKQKNGASLFLTQPVYCWDNDKAQLAASIRAAGLKLLIGLMPLVSFRNASYMDQEVPGIRIPAETINAFRPDMTREEAEQTGLKQILDLAAEVKQHADGFYLIAPFNRAYLIKEFMNRFKQTEEKK